MSKCHIVGNHIPRLNYFLHFLDEDPSGNFEEVLLRKHYWKLKHANEEILSENEVCLVC